eukprot:scaffold6163_cov64-Phaeocystis_antarctica.AAC.1
MVILPTDTLSGRDGGSASALLAGYGRPGLKKGPHNQRVECGARPERTRRGGAPASAAPVCVGEMAIRPTDTLSGREGGSASALLAGYGRPGMSEGAHNRRAEWSLPGVNQAGRRAGLRSTCVCRRNGREGGSALALLAGYGRPGMSEGAHNQSAEWSLPGERTRRGGAPASAAPVCLGEMAIRPTQTLSRVERAARRRLCSPATAAPE